jgi:NitT/TauT family transport system permease protein
VILIVVATDQLVWRPLIAWSDKFKFEQVESADRVTSPILELLRRSSLLSSLPGRIWTSIEEPIYRRMARTQECRVVHPVDEEKSNRQSLAGTLGTGRGGQSASSVWGAVQAVLMLARSPGPICAAARRRRSHLSCASTPRCSSPPLGPSPSASPSASTPARPHCPARRAGAGLRPGHGLLSHPAHRPGQDRRRPRHRVIALMLLGTQWYILFNVIAGAMSIPSDLREVSSLYHFTRWQRWTKLILPGIFPYLITGMVTASGGAWNASVLPSTRT